MLPTAYDCFASALSVFVSEIVFMMDVHGCHVPVADFLLFL